VRPRRSLVPSTIAAVILLIGALYMGQASRTAAEPAQWQTVAAVLAGAAVLVLVVRMIRRR
jgi:ABC-type phosphate/phosphonate transport system permease subunit